MLCTYNYREHLRFVACLVRLRDLQSRVEQELPLAPAGPGNQSQRSRGFRFWSLHLSSRECAWRLSFLCKAYRVQDSGLHLRIQGLGFSVQKRF